MGNFRLPVVRISKHLFFDIYFIQQQVTFSLEGFKTTAIFLTYVHAIGRRQQNLHILVNLASVCQQFTIVSCIQTIRGRFLNITSTTVTIAPKTFGNPSYNECYTLQTGDWQTFFSLNVNRFGGAISKAYFPLNVRLTKNKFINTNCLILSCLEFMHTLYNIFIIDF